MPLGDFGALSIFGIQCKTSESVLKDPVRHSEWKTYYYGDRRSQVVGMSTSVGSQGLNEEMGFSKWETRYYDAMNWRTIGTSIAVGKDYCRTNLNFREWETTYYEADGSTVICKSTSLGEGTGFRQRNTRYYKGTLYLSNSVGSDWSSNTGFRKWETTYVMPELIVQLGAQKGEGRENIAQRRRDPEEAPSHQNYLRLKQVPEEDPTKTIEKLKRYYVSTAGFFNASRQVFKGSDRNEVVKALEDRARKNPGGASEKTLKRFDLKLI